MLVNYLQTQSLLPNFQDKRLIRRDDLGVVPDFKSFIHEERLGEEEMKRFKSMLTEENLQEFELDPLTVKKCPPIDTWINDSAENR